MRTFALKKSPNSSVPPDSQIGTSATRRISKKPLSSKPIFTPRNPYSEETYTRENENDTPAQAKILKAELSRGASGSRRAAPEAGEQEVPREAAAAIIRAELMRAFLPRRERRPRKMGRRAAFPQLIKRESLAGKSPAIVAAQTCVLLLNRAGKKRPARLFPAARLYDPVAAGYAAQVHL